jgi:succinate dehydrogenase/fumarate reductase-like Fe-S protein
MVDARTRERDRVVSEPTTTLLVSRGASRDDTTIETYTVTCEDGLTLLEALIRIRRDHDPSLAVRYSCKANACKECSAMIDGTPGYLCAQRAVAGATTRIEPLRKPRLIRDLVTELF